MIHMVHEGGGYSPAPTRQTAPDRTDPVQHRVGSGDTLQSLAAQYSVSPEAILQANPQLGADGALPSGELLEIPPPPQSVAGDVDQGSAKHSTTDVRVTLKNDDGSITWKPDSTAVKLTDKQKLELGNSRPEGSPAGTNGFSVSLASESSVTLTESQSDTHTTFSVATGTQVTLSGEASAGGARGASVEGSVATGFTSTYKVSLPGEATVEQAAAVNPFDPTTIPVGGSVTVDGSAFVNTSFEAAFRYMGTQTRISDAEGVSYTVARIDEDTVRVTMGPTETLNAFNGVGLSVGDITVMAGREDQLHGAELATAEFDISTPEGQAAFEHFNATGQVAHDTPGVSSVATISRVDYSSQTQLRVGLGDNAGIDLGGQANLGSSVRVTYPDGSYSQTTDLSYGGNVPLTIEQRFDANGNELPGERSYRFEVSTDRPSHSWFERLMGANEAAEEQALADKMNWVLGGGFGADGPVEAGDTVTLEFSEAQMQQLMDLAQATVDGNTIGGANSDLNAMLNGYGGDHQLTPMEFAIAMARNMGQDPVGFTDLLYRISAGADGDNANDQYARIEVDATVP